MFCDLRRSWYCCCSHFCCFRFLFCFCLLLLLFFIAKTNNLLAHLRLASWGMIKDEGCDSYEDEHRDVIHDDADKQIQRIDGAREETCSSGSVRLKNSKSLANKAKVRLMAPLHFSFSPLSLSHKLSRLNLHHVIRSHYLRLKVICAATWPSNKLCIHSFSQLEARGS